MILITSLTCRSGLYRASLTQWLRWWLCRGIVRVTHLWANRQLSLLQDGTGTFCSPWCVTGLMRWSPHPVSGTLAVCFSFRRGLSWKTSRLLVSILVNIHCQDKSGKALLCNKSTRTKLMQFLATCPSSVVVMEACVGAHFMTLRISDIGNLSLCNLCIRLSRTIKMILLMLMQYVTLHPNYPCVLSNPEQKVSRRCVHCTGPGNHSSPYQQWSDGVRF